MEQMRRNVWLLGAAVCAGCWIGAAHAVDWIHYPALWQAGSHGIVIGDFNGDGLREAAVSGVARSDDPPRDSALIGVLATDAAGLLSIRDVLMVPQRLRGAILAGPRAGAADRLVAAVTDDETVSIVVVGDVPLRVLRTIPAPLVQSLQAVADIDGDGEQEIVALAGYYSSQPYLAVIDYETGELEWSGTETITGVVAAQLDADPAMELVLEGLPGRVIDGATHALEWTWPAGFNGKLVAGHFDADPSVAGFAVADMQVQVFRSQPFSPTHEFYADGATTITRVSWEGRDQIAFGSSEENGIVIRDPRSGAILLGVENPRESAAALAFGDIDSDGRTELLHGETYPDPGSLRVVDLGTMNEDFLARGEAGPYAAVVRGDISGGGQSEVAYLTTGSSAGSSSSVLRVLDAASGSVSRERIRVFYPYEPVQPGIAAAQFDGDAQLEIVIAGSREFHGEVAVLDGLSLEDQWRRGGYDGPFQVNWLVALALVEANGDGVPDIVVATRLGQIVLLDGSSGTELWRSVTLGDSPVGLAAFRDEADTPLVAVASGRGLYVFDLSSRLLRAGVKSKAPLSVLSQWGSGLGCMLATVDVDSAATFFTCDSLEVIGMRPLPEGTVFLRPADVAGEHLFVAAAGYIHDVAPDGSSERLSEFLGTSLGNDNQGSLAIDGQHVDFVIGSEYMITHFRAAPDALFTAGFE